MTAFRRNDLNLVSMEKRRFEAIDTAAESETGATDGMTVLPRLNKHMIVERATYAMLKNRENCQNC